MRRLALSSHIKLPRAGLLIEALLGVDARRRSGGEDDFPGDHPRSGIRIHVGFHSLLCVQYPQW